MPFPVEPKYIQAAEQSLGIQLPPRFKARLSAENGGEILLEPDNEDSSCTLLPVFDTSDKKRLRHTCNHIAKDWRQSMRRLPAPIARISATARRSHLPLVERRRRIGASSRQHRRLGRVST